MENFQNLIAGEVLLLWNVQYGDLLFVLITATSYESKEILENLVSKCFDEKYKNTGETMVSLQTFVDLQDVLKTCLV